MPEKPRKRALLRARLKRPTRSADTRSVKLIPLLASLCVAGALVVAAAAASPLRHTAQEAQTNILRAARVLGRFSPALVDPRTKLMKNNSTATCRGVSHVRGAAASVFVCVVSSGRVHVRVRYLAQRHNGFELRRLKVWRSPA
jgi:hypothetical protein